MYETVNEQRARHGMPPIEGGDVLTNVPVSTDPKTTWLYRIGFWGTVAAFTLLPLALLAAAGFGLFSVVSQ